MQNYSAFPRFITQQEYFNYMESVDSNILIVQEVPIVSANNARINTLNDWAEQYHKDDIIKELGIVCSKGESKKSTSRIIKKTHVSKF